MEKIWNRMKANDGINSKNVSVKVKNLVDRCKEGGI